MSYTETSDIYLAGYLRYKGTRLTSWKMTKGKMYFQFEKNGETEDLIAEYRIGSALIPARSLRDNIRDIKTMVTKAKGEDEAV